jgi:cytochrome c553
MNWRLAASCALLVGSIALAGTTVALAGGDKEFGEYLSSECVTCHQISGKFDGIPSIVGWPEQSLIRALTEYREKIRENAVMRSIAVKFSDEEIAALAAYFNSAGTQSQQSMSDTTGADAPSR